MNIYLVQYSYISVSATSPCLSYYLRKKFVIESPLMLMLYNVENMTPVLIFYSVLVKFFIKKGTKILKSTIAKLFVS